MQLVSAAGHKLWSLLFHSIFTCFIIKIFMLWNNWHSIQVPADSNTEQCVNFRALIISKCQHQFETNKVDDTVKKIELDIKECTDPVSISKYCVDIQHNIINLNEANVFI